MNPAEEEDGRRVMHAEVRVGDSMIELGDVEGEFKPRSAQARPRCSLLRTSRTAIAKGG